MLSDDGPDHRGDDLCRFDWVTVKPELTRSSAAALLAVAAAYGADADSIPTRLGTELDKAIQPLRDVLTHAEALEGDTWLHEAWVGREAP